MPTNRILAAIAPKDLALVQPHLEAADLQCCSYLQIRNQRIQRVYFIEAGIISVLSRAEEPIEVVIGNEGMSHL